MRSVLRLVAVVLAVYAFTPRVAEAQWGPSCPNCMFDMWGGYCSTTYESDLSACSTQSLLGSDYSTYCAVYTTPPGVICGRYEAKLVLPEGTLERAGVPASPSMRWTAIAEGTEMVAACNGAILELRYSESRAEALRSQLNSIVIA